MHIKTILVTLALLVAAASGDALAQGNGAAQGRLPNGKPFQILQQSIRNLEASLQAQIANLQAQLDANAANDAALAQMVASLEVAVSLLEDRMSAAEASIQELREYNEVQDALLAFQMQRINAIQSQIASQGANINLLFNLHNAQQNAINSLQGAVGFLSSQNNAQQLEINNLSGQLSQLGAAYVATRNQLGFGCPVNSSIRQVIPRGPVICEPDTGRAIGSTFGLTFTVPAGGLVNQAINCPPNTTATGGGVQMPSVGQLLSTMPLGNGWRVVIRSTGPAFFATVTVRCLTIGQ